MPDITRRSALGSGALGVGLVALAACSNGSGGGASPQSQGETAGGPVDDSGTPRGSSDAAAGTGVGGGGTAIIKLADVPVGGSASAGKVNGHPCVVSQKSPGVVAAFSAICTHEGCTVKPAGAQFHCPCHGSRYDAFTGDVLQGPAPRALSKISVAISDDDITTN